MAGRVRPVILLGYYLIVLRRGSRIVEEFAIA